MIQNIENWLLYWNQNGIDLLLLEIAELKTIFYKRGTFEFFYETKCWS